MEDFLQIILTSIIQGITEFLPISSSGHISFLNEIFSWNDINLTLIVTAHFGTLFAVIHYFWPDVRKIFIHGFLAMCKQKKNTESNFFLKIFYSTLPIIICGAILKYNTIEVLYSNFALVLATSFFAIVLFIADKTKVKKNINNLSFTDAFIIGLFQLFALIPGASRAGLCISAGRFLGLNRICAATYSMYLSIPAIVGASFLVILEMVNNIPSFSWLIIFSVFTASFVFAFITIKFFMKILKRVSLTFFVIYRIIFSLILASLFF